MPIRFTNAEGERLAKTAKASDQTLSEWIRRAVLAALISGPSRLSLANYLKLNEEASDRGETMALLLNRMSESRYRDLQGKRNANAYLQ